MTAIDPPVASRTRERMLRDLQDLMHALDRRVPRLERTGEAEIARSAAALREQTLRRIAEIEQEPRGPAVSSPAARRTP